MEIQGAWCTMLRYRNMGLDCDQESLGAVELVKEDQSPRCGHVFLEMGETYFSSMNLYKTMF